MIKIDLFKKAKNEINRVLDFINNNQHIFNTYYDLKLYSAFFYANSDDFNTDFPYICAKYSNAGTGFFYDFCNAQYSCFVENLKNDFNIDFEKSIFHISRTSKFYLYENHNADADEIINNFIGENCENGAPVNVYKRALIANNNGVFNSDDINSALTYISENLYNDVVSSTETARKIYAEINAFKENQVSDFKAYCDYYESNAENDAENEKRKIAHDHDVATNIINSYHIPPEIVTTLKRVLYAY
mgnify:CR=1 FL=1